MSATKKSVETTADFKARNCRHDPRTWRGNALGTREDALLVRNERDRQEEKAMIKGNPNEFLGPGACFVWIAADARRRELTE